MKTLSSLLAFVLILTISPLAASTTTGGQDVADREPPGVLDTRDLRRIGQLIPLLAGKRVVYIGESHDRYDHHLNQLEIIRGLHAIDPNLAIGMEFFQQPFQEHLDRFIAGEMSERDMLERTEYFHRWKYDYRLYRQLVRFARDEGIPLIALNLPQEVTRKVGREGIGALTGEEAVWVPDEIDRSDEEYHARLRRVFDQHPDTSRSFEGFLDVQLMWDEGMAQRAAEWLRDVPEGRLVVLAGVGHIAHGSGIPQRVARRIEAESAIVIHQGGEPPDPESADFILFSRQQRLTPFGMLGVFIGRGDEEGVPVADLTPEGPAEEAGITAGDRIIALDGEPVRGLVDLRLGLMDRRAGEEVVVTVRRAPSGRRAREIDYEVTLH